MALRFASSVRLLMFGPTSKGLPGTATDERLSLEKKDASQVARSNTAVKLLLTTGLLYGSALQAHAFDLSPKGTRYDRDAVKAIPLHTSSL